MKPPYAYHVQWEDGRTVAKYLSNQTPPKVGGKIDINYHDFPVIFEVLDVTSKPAKGNEMVVLKVKPVIE